MSLAISAAPAAQAADSVSTKPNLIGLSKAELKQAMVELGEKPFRATQLWHWMYHRGETDFDRMTTLHKDFRARLADNYEIRRPRTSVDLKSVDGTRKWLLKMDDGNEIETVHIPEEDRGTLCVSSQIGCTLTCSFCHTGTMRLVRNLTSAEIVGQVMLARDGIGEWPSPSEGRMISNIVMMGMGEPLYNFEEVKKALHICMDAEGIALSRRRITLSTSGIVPGIKRAGEEIGTMLAISLHAVTDELRNVLVPINKKYPLKELMDACRTYPGATNARRITFEYTMLKGINDSPAEARQLVRMLQGIPAKVNLIPFNPWPGAPYECSTDEAIAKFADIVNAAGYASPVRTPRGRDIFAACGQLKSASERPRKSRLDGGLAPAPQVGVLPQQPTVA